MIASEGASTPPRVGDLFRWVIFQYRIYALLITNYLRYSWYKIMGATLCDSKYASILGAYNPEYWSGARFCAAVLSFDCSACIQQCLYFFPLPQGHGSFLLIFFVKFRTCVSLLLFFFSPAIDFYMFDLIINNTFQ